MGPPPQCDPCFSKKGNGTETHQTEGDTPRARVGQAVCCSSPGGRGGGSPSGPLGGREPGQALVSVPLATPLLGASPKDYGQVR